MIKPSVKGAGASSISMGVIVEHYTASWRLQDGRNTATNSVRHRTLLEGGTAIRTVAIESQGDDVKVYTSKNAEDRILKVAQVICHLSCVVDISFVCCLKVTVDIGFAVGCKNQSG